MKRNVRIFLCVILLAEIAMMACAAFGENIPEAAERAGQAGLVKIQREFHGAPGAKNIVMILFLAIGPLKIVPAFVKLTANADDKLRKQLAFRGFWISTLTIVLVALLGQRILSNYKVSLSALTTAAGLVLSLVALQTILNIYRPAQEAAGSPEQPSLALTISPLSFPLILPPFGVAIVMLLMLIGSRVDANTHVILGIIVMWMVLDYLAMLGARSLMKILKPSILQVFGAVMGIVQLAIGISLLYYSIEIEVLSIWQMMQH